MFCSKCGKQLSEGTSFCLYCGASQGETVQSSRPSASQPQGIPALPKEMQMLIRKNSDYYIRKFSGFQAANSNTSWNWAAFFLSTGWCFYRKMYAAGAVLAAISIICSMIPVVNIISGLAICIACGVLGNSFYHKHLLRTIKDAEDVGLSEDAWKSYALEKGGVSLASGFLFSLFISAINLLLNIYTTTILGSMVGGFVSGLL